MEPFEIKKIYQQALLNYTSLIKYEKFRDYKSITDGVTGNYT